MKKKCLSLLAASALFPFCANGADVPANELEWKLSEYFADVYPQVSVKENSGVLEAVLPEIETFDFRFDSEGNIKEIEGKIPSVVMKVTEAGEFKGYPRYKLSTDSIARLQGMAYRSFAVQGIEVASYKEDFYFVPELKTVDSRNFNAHGITQFETDADTGLKSEVFGISDLTMDMSWLPSGDDVGYKMSWKASGIVLKNPLITVKVSEASNNMQAVYEDKATGDYQKLLMNIAALKTSNSVLTGKGIAMDFMGISSSFDMVSKGSVLRDDDAGVMSVKADSLLSRINASGFANFALREVKVKYLLKNISVEEIRKFAALQDKILELESKETKTEAVISGTSVDEADKFSPEEEALAKEAVEIIDNILKTAEYKMRIELVFDDAGATLLLALKKSGEYVVGNGKITLLNFDKIVPDYAKQCEEEQKNNPASFAESCLKAGMTDMVRAYVDTSKRKTNDKGQTVDEVDIVLNEQGVYVGSEKITDAVEFNLSKLLTEYLVQQSQNKEALAEVSEISIDTDE